MNPPPDENTPHQFERVPQSPGTKTVHGRPARTEILAWWDEQYGVPPHVFDGYTFWEKGAGMLWIHHGVPASPLTVEALGMRCLRIRQKHWKPTTVAVQRYGHHAHRNVIHLSHDEATAFTRGNPQIVDWDGDRGYLIATRTIADEPVPIGVGLYTDGTLKSQIPKAHQRNLP